MSYTDKTFLRAHELTAYHKNKLESSEFCGCYMCHSIFRTNRIETWVDGGQTALCPFCHMDAVIPESPRIPLCQEFLKAFKLGGLILAGD